MTNMQLSVHICISIEIVYSSVIFLFVHYIITWESPTERWPSFPLPWKTNSVLPTSDDIESQVPLPTVCGTPRRFWGCRVPCQGGFPVSRRQLFWRNSLFLDLFLLCQLSYFPSFPVFIVFFRIVCSLCFILPFLFRSV